jgi:ligand-binding sensor domain-containing protein
MMGLFSLTQNNGTTWRCISDNLPQDFWVSRVQFSKHDPNRIYASLNGYRWDDFTPYVYVSNDLGASWTDISSNLPKSAVNVIREDATNKNLLYVGTDNGLFVSIDQGKNWHIFNTNIPRVAVHDLFIQESANHLLVGTHGRSIYLLALDAVQQLPGVSDKLFVVLAPKPQKHNKRWGSKSKGVE